MVRAINLRLALQATAIKVSANLVTQLIIHLRAPGGHSPFDEQQVIEFAVYGFVGSQVGNVIQFILEDCFPTGHAMRGVNEVLPPVHGDVNQVLEKKDDDKKAKTKTWFNISPDLIWRNVLAKLVLDQTIGLAISGSVFLICTNIARVSHPSMVLDVIGDRLWPLIKAGWHIWPLVAICNFLWVPRRSWVGCTRCKSFKKKCSEERPACQRCTLAGAKCEYGVKLRWGGRPFNRSPFGDCLIQNEGNVQRLDLNHKNFIYVSPSTAGSSPPKDVSSAEQTTHDSQWVPPSPPAASESSESSQLILCPPRTPAPLTPSAELFGHLSPLHRSGLQYFTERTVRALVPHPQVFNELCELILPMAMFSEPLLQSIVALAATHRLASCQTKEEQSAQALVVADCQALSSRSLCQKLSDCAEDQELIPLLATARALFVCEAFASEPHADRWSVHFRGARGLISRIQDKGLLQRPSDELRFLLRWFDMTESLVCHSISDLAPKQSAIPSPTTLRPFDSDDEPVHIDMYLARTKDLLNVFKEIARLSHIRNERAMSEALSEDGQNDAEVWWLLSYLQSIIDRDQANPPPVMSIRNRVLSVAEIQEYRLSNQIWQLTGLLLIHRRLLHVPRSSALIQDLIQRILECTERMTLRDGLTPVTLLTPPLFFAGCDALWDDRPRIKTALQGVSSSLGLLNTQKALEILEEYWEVDPGIEDELADRSWPRISQFLPY
ncbi:hypothetical protein FLONG3_5136 [Fusarium longipes]|uniref:Zn(2)-C6 fungal-type domain-containing protein n=1 Tax=Fusarium longipes TaxID=694270 RepID=A0A395SWV2_9HYPO|nr:hypothetical protein FLONG3_5136 [Fusarium longipes]